MTVSPLTEADIIDLIYSTYEVDDTTWSTSDAEYLTARRLCNGSIRRWEYLEGVRWNELFTTLTSASTGTKTVTAGTYVYDCPDDMRVPPKSEDFVRVNGELYPVVALSKIQQLGDSMARYYYFTGNPKLGYKLNFNTSLVFTTGHIIEYEYYRSATYFSAPTSSTEMSNPMFIVHDVLSRLYRGDGMLTESRDELQFAENLLQEMKAENFEVISDDVAGFGI
jgi:hypothetical protein